MLYFKYWLYIIWDIDYTKFALDKYSMYFRLTNLQERKKGKERIKKQWRKKERKGRRDRGRKSPCKIMQSEMIKIYIIVNSMCLFTCFFGEHSFSLLVVLVGLRKHKLESRLPGEISITSDVQMTPPLWQKVKRN